MTDHPAWYEAWVKRIWYKPPPPLKKGPVSLRHVEGVGNVPVYGKQTHTGTSDKTLHKRRGRRPSQ